MYEQRRNRQPIATGISSVCSYGGILIPDRKQGGYCGGLYLVDLCEASCLEIEKPVLRTAGLFHKHSIRLKGV